MHHAGAARRRQGSRRVGRFLHAHVVYNFYVYGSRCMLRLYCYLTAHSLDGSPRSAYPSTTSTYYVPPTPTPIKLWLGAVKNLDSPSLRKDGVCSAVGALIAFCVAISGLVEHTPSWWADGAVAIVVALCLLVVRGGLHEACVPPRHGPQRRTPLTSSWPRGSLGRPTWTSAPKRNRC